MNNYAEIAKGQECDHRGTPKMGKKKKKNK